MEQADCTVNPFFSPTRTPELINLQGTTAKPLFAEWIVCHAENCPKIIIYDEQLSAQLPIKRN